MEEGMRIHSTESFEKLFSKIFPRVQDLLWFFESDSFEAGTDELWSSLKIDTHLVSEPGRFGSVHEFGCWSRTNIFPKYADLVKEDWNWILGTENTSLDGKIWLKEYYQVKDRHCYVKRHCNVCFLNIDAAFWEFYSQDDVLLRTVEKQLLEFGNVRTESCSLKTSHGL